MNKKRVRLFVAAISTVLVLLFIGCGVYVYQVHKNVERSIGKYMDEIAQHDMKSLEGKITDFLAGLNAISERVRYQKPQTIDELCLLLNKESTGISYNQLMLLRPEV